MARSAVRTFNGRFANVQGADTVQKLLASLPEQMTPAIQAAIDQGGDDLAAQAAAIAPVSELEAHPGDLRASVHREPNGRALSTSVVADAKDAQGAYYAAHVEYGHLAKDGRHVPAVPFFWPSYRVTRKKIRSRISRAITKAVKAVSAEG